MDAKSIIEQFLRDEMDIVEFRRLYDEHGEINDFLQGVIDNIRETGAEVKQITYETSDKISVTTGRTVAYLVHPNTSPQKAYGHPHESVRKLLTFEYNRITHNIRTAAGASKFYDEVFDIYTQIDPTIPHLDKYYEAFSFMLDAVPSYLEGGLSEMYIQEYIIPLFPDTMTKTARKKAIRAKIKEEFRSDKGYPAWPQSSQWPMGKDGKPAVYTGKKKKNGDLVQFFFRDESDDNNIIIVEDFY